MDARREVWVQIMFKITFEYMKIVCTEQVNKTSSCICVCVCVCACVCVCVCLRVPVCVCAHMSVRNMYVHRSLRKFDCAVCECPSTFSPNTCRCVSLTGHGRLELCPSGAPPPILAMRPVNHQLRFHIGFASCQSWAWVSLRFRKCKAAVQRLLLLRPWIWRGMPGVGVNLIKI